MKDKGKSMPTKDNGNADWSKMFMGMAVAIVFVMQAYQQGTQNQHGAQISDMSKQIVPRAEVQTTYVPHHEITKSQEQLEKQISLLTKTLQDLAEMKHDHDK